MTKYNFGEIVIIDFPLSGLIQRKRRPALIILDIGDRDNDTFLSEKHNQIIEI